MLKCTVKISLCLLLHVSVQLDHPQGAYADHIVTQLPFRYKSGSCICNHTSIAVSTSLLLWYRHTPSVASAAHINGSPCWVHILFCMSWLGLRDNRHGCPLDHLQTLRNIAWYAALSFHRQHKTPSIISEVRLGNKLHPQKPPRTSTRKHVSNVVDIAHRLTYWYNLTDSCATCCMLPLLQRLPPIEK